MSEFIEQDLDALCLALQMNEGANPSIELTNSIFELAKQHNVLWPLMSNGGLHVGNPLVSSLKSQIQTLAEALPEELKAVNEALSAVCRPIYLKGAAILIEHNFAPQLWRYMADFDMLVEKNDFKAAISAMEGIGYSTNADEQYLPRLNPHFPIFCQTGRICGIEIHTRLLQDQIRSFLDPDDIRTRAQTIQTSQGPILIASIYDRLIHLIAHAQIGSHRYHRRQFLIRDAVEFYYLLSRPNADYEAVKTTFQAAGYITHFESFVAMASNIMPIKSFKNTPWPRKKQKWVVEARRNILDKQRHNLWVIKDWARIGGIIIFTPSKWRSYTKLIMRGNYLTHKVDKQFK